MYNLKNEIVRMFSVKEGLLGVPLQKISINCLQKEQIK